MQTSVFARYRIVGIIAMRCGIVLVSLLWVTIIGCSLAEPTDTGNFIPEFPLSEAFLIAHRAAEIKNVPVSYEVIGVEREYERWAFHFEETKPPDGILGDDRTFTIYVRDDKSARISWHLAPSEIISSEQLVAP
ncbi:MAG: hypothetical protein SVV80_13715 [Planctomycetota bacterium]|nr:hypothetical protein [Planctomycetota bacterium]